jgi:hypothetical protein
MNCKIKTNGRSDEVPFKNVSTKNLYQFSNSEFISPASESKTSL